MGLSPLFVDRVLELIRTINKEGVTIFMVEQNASLALRDRRTRPTCCRPAASCCPARRATLLDDPRIRDAYLGGAEVA